jgi:hypothetical protein
MTRFVITTAIVALAALSLVAVPPAPVAAQGNLIWDLTQDHFISNLRYNHKYPDGWQFVADWTGGRFVASAADGEALTDSDPTTNAEDYHIFFSAIKATELGLKPFATVEESLGGLLAHHDLRAEADPTEIGLMSYRSLTVVVDGAFVDGDDGDERLGLLTVWQQRGLVVYYLLSAPEMSEDVGVSWGMFLASFTATNYLEFGDDAVTLAAAGITVTYPQGWTTGLETKDTGRYSIAVFEDAADMQNPAQPASYVVVMSEFAMEALNDLGIKSLEQVAAMSAISMDESSVTVDQHIFLEQPGYVVRGKMKNGDYWALNAVFVFNETAITIGVVAPNEEKLDQIEPSFITMLLPS